MVDLSLIEKLEAGKAARSSSTEAVFNAGIDEAITIIRQHEPEQPQDVVERVADVLERFFGRSDILPDAAEAVIAAMRSGDVHKKLDNLNTSGKQAQGLDTSETLNGLSDKIWQAIHDKYPGAISPEMARIAANVARSEISEVKPGTLSINIEETLKALHTQYQIRGDAIVPRASADAPSIEQMSLIREAHLNIIPILKALKAAQPMRESGHHPLGYCTYIDNDGKRKFNTDFVPQVIACYEMNIQRYQDEKWSGAVYKAMETALNTYFLDRIKDAQ